jgi:hypothetical protein
MATAPGLSEGEAWAPRVTQLAACRGLQTKTISRAEEQSALLSLRSREHQEPGGYFFAWFPGFGLVADPPCGGFGKARSFVERVRSLSG